jgi:hypothetical protein
MDHKNEVRRITPPDFALGLNWRGFGLNGMWCYELDLNVIYLRVRTECA